MPETSSRDRQSTEQRLRNAAVEVWSEHGFHGAPVSAIAERAGANVSLINRYFGGKQGLLLAIVQGMIDQKQTGEVDYPPQESLSDEILEYLRFRYREDMRLQHTVRIVISEMSTNREFRNNALTSLTYAADENFRARLKGLRERGVLSPSTDIEALFRQISLFSFSANFIEGMILEMPAQVTDGIFVGFSQTVSGQYT